MVRGIKDGKSKKQGADRVSLLQSDRGDGVQGSVQGTQDSEPIRETNNGEKLLLIRGNREISSRSSRGRENRTTGSELTLVELQSEAAMILDAIATDATEGFFDHAERELKESRKLFKKAGVETAAHAMSLYIQVCKETKRARKAL